LLAENNEANKKLCANRFQLWIYRVYPSFPEILKKFELKVKELGGSNLKFESGKFFKIIELFLGWKITKKIQIFAKKIGWNYISKLKKNLN